MGRTVGEHAVTIRLVGRLQPTVNVVVWDPENPHASPAEEPVAAALLLGALERLGQLTGKLVHLAAHLVDRADELFALRPP